MREQEQTSIHLLLAVTSSTFSIMLIVLTLALSWEMWIIPLILIGCFIVWWFHIGRDGSEMLHHQSRLIHTPSGQIHYIRKPLA